MNVDFITKLGGSAITEKHQYEKLKENELSQAANILSECYKSGLRFVVIHGAGSFGHHDAKDYGVNHGYLSSNKSKQHVQEGFCRTRLSVCKLNQHVVGSLVSEGVPAVSVSPLNNWSTKRGVLTQNGTVLVRHLLSEGFIPCLHGDCVLDEEQGCCILSGDVILQEICKSLSPNRVIFLTDVAGVYSKPPSEEGAEMLPEILVNESGSLETNMETTQSNHDVTGGIKQKIQSALQITLDHRGKIPVYICNEESYANICLHGDFKTQIGTKLTYCT